MDFDCLLELELELDVLLLLLVLDQFEVSVSFTNAILTIKHGLHHDDGLNL